MNITEHISFLNSNNLSQKDTSILSFRNFFNHFNYNLSQSSIIDITNQNGSAEKPHARPYLFPYMWSVKHTHGVLGCRNRTVRKTTTADNNNNNSNNSNNSNNDYNYNRNMNDNCDYNSNNNDNHNNRYKRYTKHTSHISTCTYIFFKPTNTVGINNILRKPLRMCLAVSPTATTVSPNRSSVCRIEHNDGSVEYSATDPKDAADAAETVKETKRIRTDETHKYENNR